MPQRDSEDAVPGKISWLGAEDELLDPERQCRSGGFSFVAGVDEVGRGPLAGPVVAAAVSFPPGVRIPRVNDSKQLTEAQRERLKLAIEAVEGVKIGIGLVEAEVIDRINILKATHLAMRRAVEAMDPAVEFLLIDGNPVRGLPWPSRALVKGDARSASIAAASIIAKVYRDHWMMKLAERYPGYGFAEHKGYGTARHLAALRELGACPEHRRSFGPVRMVLNPPDGEQLELFR